MRIAFISTMRGYVWGGCEELWFETAKEAIKTGHQVLAVVGHWSKPAKNIKELKTLGAEIYFQDLPRTSLSRREIRKRLQSKIKLALHGDESYIFSGIKNFKPDIICVSQANTYDITRFPHLREFLLKEKIPYTVICQGHEDIPLFDDADRGLTKSHFEKAIWVGFVAEALFKSAERHLATSISNGIVVRNPVNLSHIDNIDYPKVKKVFKLAQVARLDSITKGQDILFEALSSSKWLDRNWQLTLIGEGQHRKYLESLVQHYNLQQKVFFSGHVDDIRKVWTENHLLVLASRYEGTPLALVEAMICGRSAVVTDVGGNCEWITDNCNGFVAKAASTKELEKALECAWENRNAWEELGQKARQSALGKYPSNPGSAILKLLINKI